MGSNISKKMLTSLTAAALAIPGIACAEVGILSSNNEAPQQGSNIDTPQAGSSFGEITTDLKYTHYSDSKANSETVRSGSRKAYKIDVWNALLVVPYKRFEFKVDLQKDTQSGASSLAMNVIRVPLDVRDARSNATISEVRAQVGLSAEYNLDNSKYGITIYNST